MRGDRVSLGLALALLSTSLAHGQVTIDVSKITCDQFAQARVGSPRTTAIWLNGYYHGKNGSTTIDTGQSEAMFDELMHYCHGGKRQSARHASAGAPDEIKITANCKNGVAAEGLEAALK
jgi:hypothetical protein